MSNDINNQQGQKFKIEKLSDFGTEQPWIARIMLGLPELVDMLPFDADKRQEVNDLIFDCAQELHHAFESLTQLQKSAEDENVSILTRENQYQNLYSALWRAYKDRMPKVCKSIGYDIGFLFKDKNDFTKQSEVFISENTDIRKQLIEILADDRKTWQNALSGFRNDYIEHNKIDKEITRYFYNIANAAMVFENAWRAIEDIIVILIESKLDSTWRIYQIPEDKRDSGCSKKYVIGLTPEELENLKNAK